MQLIIRDTATAALEAIGAKLKNKAPISEAAGEAIVGLATRSFNDPTVRAASWAPLSELTLAEKLEEGTSTAILKRHVVLARSFRVIEATNDSVRVGTDRPFAHVHQWGMIIRAKTPKGLVFHAGHFGVVHLQKVTIPGRPMLPLTGGRDSPKLTKLAVRNMVSAAKAKLAEMLGGVA